MKFATKLIRHYPSHLRYIATLPWEISADIEQIWKNANKLHFKCVDFNSSIYACNCVCWVYLCVFIQIKYKKPGVL